MAIKPYMTLLLMAGALNTGLMPGPNRDYFPAGQVFRASVADHSDCPVLSGSIFGGTICSGTPGYLTFNSSSTGAQPPFTITYSDGSTNFVSNNVQDGMPFAVQDPPTTTTLYSLVSIRDAGTCPATAVTGQQGTIIVHKCVQCNNWLSLPSFPSYVDVGDLDIPGDQITVEAEINRTKPYAGGPVFAGDIVSKHQDITDINYLLRPNSAEITTADGVHHTTTPVCDVQLNKTYHVAMVYDGASLRFYRNGFLMSQVAVTGNLIQNDITTRIGHYQAILNNENFIGYFNEIRIWKVARTQMQIQNYMNSSLPSPATQAGLVAYYTFNDLQNKQGNLLWNGTAGGAAAVSQENPTCADFVPDNDCCPLYSGTISGNTICSGATAMLTFHSATPLPDPVIISYSDGSNSYVQNDVRDGVPFVVETQPTATTTYTLLNIQKSLSCPATSISGQTATVKFTSCFCSGSLGDAVLKINFGNEANPGGGLSATAPGASTTLTYIPVSGNPASPAPGERRYSISNNIPSDPNWFGGAYDHTTGDGKGYMAVYNSGAQPDVFFSRQMDNLCSTTNYQFAAWIANIVNPAVLAGVQPNLRFQVEQTDGVILGSYATGSIPENALFTWKQYGFFFTVPEHVSSVVLKIINNNSDGAAGNDFALDDISLQACGPLSTASFNAFGASAAQTVCEGSWAMLYGTVSTGYLHPVNLWQQSNDSAVSWTDIANSNSLQLKITTPVTGSSKAYLYRMLSAEENNIQTASCRIVSDPIGLTADAGPLLTIAGDTSICSGTALTLLATGGISYSWSPAQFLDNPAVANPVAAPVTETKFLVTASNLQHCESKDSVTISIRPDVLFKQPDNVTGCLGDPVTINGGNDPDLVYSWVPADYLNNPSASSPVSSTPVSTQYAMHVSDPFCKSAADFQVMVTVNPLPSVTASRSNNIDCINGLSQLNASGGLTYSWSPAEGLDDPNLKNPVAAIDSTTIFTVTAADANGCSGTSFVKVVVTDHGKASFLLPNAFTPNSDGVNDCFGIRKWGNVTLKEFSIYNRIGQRVFYTENPSACWNGTFHGEMQEPGGYVYIIKGISFCGVINRTGTFLLIR